ncbi:MAG: hypothetical protein A3F14_01380 [Gammaproteobacteria bacterium RIFCSPHIGHO2_12_FULL_43_28]|nr:MAG: hypothetical protein A3F14_01380 [Gammaproteobacteria bacterium RIFCSPHIGHO2_12_FULL_43_28]
MTDKIIHTTVDILGKPYPIRCQESEVTYLQEAASYLNNKMLDIKESGKVINLERIAIMAALNMAYEYLEMKDNKSGLMSKINQRLSQLQEKIDSAINQSKQTEFIYSAE